LTIDNALPQATEVAPASDQANAEALDTSNELTEAAEGQDKLDAEPAKKEKTPEEREIARLRRGIDRKTRQLAEARAAMQSNAPQAAVTREQPTGTNTATQADDEPIKLSRAELAQLVKQEAEKLAPTIRSQQAEIEHRKSVVDGLAKEWGQEKFDTFASELDDVLGGLAGRDGKPKPATDAIFESEMPKALIEYLTDSDNAEEAEALANANDRQAGRLIAKLEVKLAAAKPDKPQRSNAPAPLEPIKGGGKTTSSMPDPANTKAYMKWANEQERSRR
jgi:hypothetical protein